MSEQDVIETDVLIIGAGPCGLFQVFELGLLDIKAHVVDSLPQIGGQCSELYPDKPIYDIPAFPVVGAQELVDRLHEQIKPFEPTFHLGHEVSTLRSREQGGFEVITQQGRAFHAGYVIIAGGMGAFEPRRLPLTAAEALNGESVHYRVRRAEQFDDQDLVVLGGGDSALDWTLELAESARSMTLIHRSQQFKAAPASVAKMQSLAEAGQLRFVQGNVVDLATEDGALSQVEVLRSDREREWLDCQQLLVFFGLSPRLGPIGDWGLDLEAKQLRVSTETFETSEPGIYAVGDINYYPGKKKLILSGFHEAALAAFAIKAAMNPDKKVHLQYTTTSPVMHKRLGVSG